MPAILVIASLHNHLTCRGPETQDQAEKNHLWQRCNGMHYGIKRLGSSLNDVWKIGEIHVLQLVQCIYQGQSAGLQHNHPSLTTDHLVHTITF